ncbi:asparagine synthase (glutamine-hydrolyzing) [Neolewinella antarctica]|uniref:asparagine synthase (glutamine-hydrolyzing) n=1 Tax=Neolewinella antarctica TaxID=442734 RepID=A0ABX0XBG1_9BACT|nr:asparagine synthase (glutamine-hydrolyzing) [Neolewinella antarctica]NJC26316.1 asparagine synthase (glutamine-hydrolysing) [Neolewinella antarctica]
MCGIAGIYSPVDRLPPQHLETFTDALAHRGPDGRGFAYREEGRLGLGHRRLSILDLDAASDQPFVRGHLTMVYNGELYNFIELRRELEGLGHQFKSNGDTEVVLAAYEQWGADCQAKFNGMWALAIYDERRRELFLSRDRYGIKPLYYLRAPGQPFAFASETYAFKHLRGYERTFDAANLAHCLKDVRSFGAKKETVFTGLYQLPPGHCALLAMDGQLTVRRWWHNRGEITLPASQRERTERFRELFDDACRLRLRSDAPLTTALSGGMDSSSVYASVTGLLGRGGLQRAGEASRRAYCLGFPGSQRDERSDARRVVDHVGGELKEVLPVYDRDTILNDTRQFDTVFSDPNFIVRQLYAAMAADGFKVSLDGHGVDEMLFGYRNMIDSLLPFIAKEEPETYSNLLYLRLKMASFGTVDPGLVLKRAKQTVWRLLGINKHTALPVPTGPLMSPQEIVNTCMFETYLPTILQNFDRASMAEGVEIRTPFLDYRLVEFCLALPLEDLLSGQHTKIILRRAMNKRLPKKICWAQKKVGLQAPMDDLFNGPLNEFALDLIRSKVLLESPHWDGRQLANDLEEKLRLMKFRQSDGYRIWPVLSTLLINNEA